MAPSEHSRVISDLILTVTLHSIRNPTISFPQFPDTLPLFIPFYPMAVFSILRPPYQSIQILSIFQDPDQILPPLSSLPCMNKWTMTSASLSYQSPTIHVLEQLIIFNVASCYLHKCLIVYHFLNLLRADSLSYSPYVICWIWHDALYKVGV